MARVAWKSAYAGNASWTIKGVRETTREAVRQAAAGADMVIGEWVDRALDQAAREALHPTAPPATKEDIGAIREELAELRACVLALADAKAGAIAELEAQVKRLSDVKANEQDLAELQTRLQKIAERGTGYERPVVRHVMVERKRPRSPVPPRLPEKNPHET